MPTMHSSHRDISRHRSLDEQRDPSTTQATDSTSKAGTKRLFSNRNSRVRSDTADHGEGYDGEAGEEEMHSGKRRRASDWPLSNTRPANTASARAPLRNRNAPNSPTSRKSSRPSKFVEGSMNDRVSQKPPVPYLGIDEEIYERYESDHHGDSRGRRMAQPRKVIHNRESSVAVSSVTGKSETSRHSSIFRFGKSIAASFNPSNWKIWQKQNQQLDDEETVQQQILRERQEKAEQIYKELKQSGHFRGTTGSVPPGRFVRAEDLKVPQSKHDSGVDLGNDRTFGIRHSTDLSREEKRRGRIFLEPPRIPGSHRDPSPAFNDSGSVMDSKTSTPRRQSFNLARASLSNIKKAFTHESDSTPSQDCQNQARRIPSRKDLQKQQKLVKRVSDLEGKLEAARRQLSDSRGEPIPYLPPRIGRNKFVPGALSSLPSERLLSGYVSSDGNIGDNESENEIGRAVTIDHQNGSLLFMPGVIVDTDMKELHERSESAAGVSTEKPLPNPPEFQIKVIESVEKDNLSVKVPIQNEKSVQQQEIQMTTESSEVSSANDSNYEESEVEESHKKPTPRPQAVKMVSPKKNPAPRRKRKSNTFERMADDGGRYKPGADSESENESDLSLATPKKKLNTSKPARKLQKVVQEPTKPNSPPKSKASAGNKGPKSVTNVAPATRQNSQRPSRSAKLVKNNASRTTRQSVSPPPSSSFTGLNYAKPSTSATSKTGDVAYVADPSTGHGVPPMPKMPQSVRLASGEMVDTSAASSASAKMTKPKSTTETERRGRANFRGPSHPSSGPTIVSELSG